MIVVLSALLDLAIATSLTPPPEPGVEFWVSLILGFFGLVGGGAGLAAVLRVRSQNKLDSAEANETFEAARSSIMDMITEGTQTLKSDLQSARLKIGDLEREVEELRHKLDKDQAQKRIRVLERDVLFWRSRAEALQDMIDGTVNLNFLTDRRTHDEGPPTGYERRDK